MSVLRTFVDSISIAPEVFELRSDVAVLAVAVDGVRNGPSDDMSRKWLDEAREVAEAVDHQPHLEAWRSAYRSFGAKPRKFRPSFDALLRRTPSGLPQINRVVDAYNAASVKFGLPVGGENADAYAGALLLRRAAGMESFDTVADGKPQIETVEAGEVVWVDDLGVTCRRWNWRQGVRTRVNDDTQRVLFLFERLAPFALEQLYAASEDVVAKVARPRSEIVSCLIKRD